MINPARPNASSGDAWRLHIEYLGKLTTRRLLLRPGERYRGVGCQDGCPSNPGLSVSRRVAPVATRRV